MHVTGEGNRQAFRGVINRLKQTLNGHDLLFVNIVGHGGNNGDGRGPYMLAHPYRDRYKMTQFSEDIASLPTHGALIVMMAQCFSGGFNEAVLEASRARSTCVVAAASETDQSFAVQGDEAWDSFQRNWVGALAC